MLLVVFILPVIQVLIVEHENEQDLSFKRAVPQRILLAGELVERT